VPTQTPLDLPLSPLIPVHPRLRLLLYRFIREIPKSVAKFFSLLAVILILSSMPLIL